MASHRTTAGTERQVQRTTRWCRTWGLLGRGVSTEAWPVRRWLSNSKRHTVTARKLAGDVGHGSTGSLGGDTDVDDHRPKREAAEVVGLPPSRLLVKVDGHAAVRHGDSPQRSVALLMRAVAPQLDLRQILLAYPLYGSGLDGDTSVRSRASIASSIDTSPGNSPCRWWSANRARPTSPSSSPEAKPPSAIRIAPTRCSPAGCS